MLISIGLTGLGCASKSQPDWCMVNAPRMPTAAEYAIMDRQSKEWMRDHNARGEKWCGWNADGAE